MKYSIFGESHGPAIGVVIEEVPAGLELDMEFILSEMARRAPGKSATATARNEADLPEILSGVLDGVTTGAPLCAMIRNTDTRSRDYGELAYKMRPSHSDYAANVRYFGNNDFRGGGHFSGRLTAPLVFAGAIAKQILKDQNINVSSSIDSVGGIKNPSADEMNEVILNAKADGDSVGGTIKCIIEGVPAGFGGPDFGYNIEGEISRAVFAIPAVKGIEFGAGFELANMRGSVANDQFCINDGKIETKTNNSGGINGGISNGMPIEFTCVIRPTPSISKQQDSIDMRDLSETKLIIAGRHDPCIVPRALPVVEAAAAITMLNIIERG